MTFLPVSIAWERHMQSIPHKWLPHTYICTHCPAGWECNQAVKQAHVQHLKLTQFRHTLRTGSLLETLEEFVLTNVIMPNLYQHTLGLEKGMFLPLSTRSVHLDILRLKIYLKNILSAFWEYILTFW